MQMSGLSASNFSKIMEIILFTHAMTNLRNAGLINELNIIKLARPISPMAQVHERYSPSGYLFQLPHPMHQSTYV